MPWERKIVDSHPNDVQYYVMGRLLPFSHQFVASTRARNAKWKIGRKKMDGTGGEVRTATWNGHTQYKATSLGTTEATNARRIYERNTANRRTKRSPTGRVVVYSQLSCRCGLVPRSRTANARSATGSASSITLSRLIRRRLCFSVFFLRR